MLINFLHPKKIFLILLIFIILVISTVTFITGFSLGADSFRFIEWSKEVQNGNFFYSQDFHRTYQRGYTYLFTVLIISVLEFQFPYYWEYLFISINLLIYFLIFLLIYKLYLKKINSLLLYLFTFYIYFINIDQYIWISYILSDYFFYFLSCILLYNFIKFYEDFKFSNLIFILVVITISIFTRPIFFVFFIIICLHMIYFVTKKYYIIFNIFFFSLLFILYYFFIKYSYFEYFFFDKTFVRLKEFYTEGVIVRMRPHTYLQFNDLNIFNFFKLFIYKFTYIFIFIDKLYSLKHNIINTTTFLPTYFFIIYAIYKYKNYNDFEKNIIFNSIIFILSFSFFICLTYIDYDWRYRLPIYFPMVIISIIGFKKFLKM